MAQPSRIQRTRPQVHSLLRSTVTITSIADVLTELVQNALDAEARQVDCWLSLERWSVRVQDDGHGIRLGDLRLLGERYATSKDSGGDSTGRGDTFGFRGEALASIAAVSSLEITTKHRVEQQSCSKFFKGGKVLACGASMRYQHANPGTDVIARDLFFNVPVRRTTLARNDPFIANDALATARPEDLSAPVSVLAACKKALEIIATVHPRVAFSLTLEGDTAAGVAAKSLLRMAKTDSTLKRFGAIFGQSHLESVREVHVSFHRTRVDGFISLSPAFTKSHQHIYLSKYHLDRCSLHKVVGDRFAKSRFGRNIDDESGKFPGRSPSHHQVKPVYLLNISLPRKEVDVALEPRKRRFYLQDEDALTQLLGDVIDAVLLKEGLLSGTAPLLRGSPLVLPGIPHQSPKTAKDHSALALDQDCPQLREKPESQARTSPITPTRRKRKREEIRIGMPEWVEQIVKKRTVQPFQPIIDRPLTAVKLDKLDDSVLPQTEAASPPSKKLGSIQETFTAESLSKAKVLAQVDSKFICCSLPASDPRKRVLILVDQHAADERIRVERYLSDLCDGFQADTISFRDLSATPLLMLLRTQQVAWLAESPAARSLLHRWAFKLGLPVIPTETREKYTQVEVVRLPSIVLDRLEAQDGKEIQRTLQGYIEFLMDEDLGGLHRSLRAGTESVPSAVVLRWCPRRLKELINSKACRGAIMFNDALTPEQCRELIAKLATTEFPFICAHGRPSMIPLLEYSIEVHNDGAGSTSERQQRAGHGINWPSIRLE